MCILLSLLGKGSVKSYRGNEYKSNNRSIVGGVVFYAVRVVSKESRRLVLPRTSYLFSSFPHTSKSGKFATRRGDIFLSQQRVQARYRHKFKFKLILWLSFLCVIRVSLAPHLHRNVFEANTKNFFFFLWRYSPNWGLGLPP
jgi:hypothetical protein